MACLVAAIVFAVLGALFLVSGLGAGIGIGLLATAFGLSFLSMGLTSFSGEINHTAYQLETGSNNQKIHQLETIKSEDYIKFSNDMLRELILPRNTSIDPAIFFDLYLLNQDIKNPDAGISLDDKISQHYTFVETKLIIINNEMSNIHKAINAKQQEMDKEANNNKRAELENEIMQSQHDLELYQQRKLDVFDNASKQVSIPDEMLHNAPKTQERLESINLYISSYGIE